jgi:hypothetical protein
MKTKLLSQLIFLICSTLCLGQDDCQWLISNGNGKSNYDAGKTEYNNSVSNKFTLWEVSMPDKNINLNAANDVFIIYKDGNHFNSRSMSSLGRFFDADVASDVMNHNFSAASSVGYMYLTDIYESDDPPDMVRVTDGNDADGDVNSIGVTDAALLSADHHVVLTKDITIIVNIGALTDKQRESIAQII